jgi:predicted aspartyl protease
MIFDTGASEVYFTPDIVLTLIRAKTITEEDILEGGLFIDANGNVNKSVRFNLKSVKIGNTTVENVPCAVAKSMDGSNLLGLSALKKIGRFEFDFKNSAIRF